MFILTEVLTSSLILNFMYSYAYALYFYYFKSKLCFFLWKEINVLTKNLNIAISYVNHKYFQYHS